MDAAIAEQPLEACMKVAVYVLAWVLGTAALPFLLTPQTLDATVSWTDPRPPDRDTNVGVAEVAAAEVATPAPPAEPPPPKTDVAVGRASDLLGGATHDALAYAELDRGEQTLALAAAALRDAPETTLTLTARVLEIPLGQEHADRAWWLAGAAHQALEQWDEALAAYDSVGDSVVYDYLEVRRLTVLLATGEADEAAERAADLVAALADTHHTTLHSARELRVRALFEAARYADYVDEAGDFLDRYPEFPRRDRIWFETAQAHLALGRLDRAAAYFDRVVWEYPYRPLAHVALLNARTLQAAGVAPPRHSLNERFEQARRHRINKHWDIVDRLLADLLRDVLEDQGETGFANEIRYERWRNAYGANDYATALTHLQAIDEAGREGIRSYELMTSLADTYARLGEHERGIQTLRDRDQGRSTVRRHSELAAYYQRWGFFTEAVQHSREVLSDRSQSGWDFSLLLFMAGEYGEAADNFETLADHRNGETGRRYRYWQGRSLQEDGQLEDAREAFEAVIASYAWDYYGLQAGNRILELDRTEPRPVLVEVEPVDAPERQRAEHPSLDDLAEAALSSLNVGLSEFVWRQVDPPVAPEPESSGFTRPARLHWDGPDGVPDTRLALVVSDHGIDSAYYVPPPQDGLERLAHEYGHLLPSAERAAYLDALGLRAEARVEARNAAIEFRALDRSFRSRRPRAGRPTTLSSRRFAHYIDNRSVDTGYWGIRLNTYRFPVPDNASARSELADRHIAIYEQRAAIRETLQQGLMDVGDYHLVRRFARDRGGWYNTPPDGDGRHDWAEAYPRAFPEIMHRYTERYELNPYVMWALMAVESSFNPDSISRANARGLLQVIPKTGELISERLGYWDFGPHNLMNPELSIEYGSYYFSELMTKFHGQELLAFSGYNAGPHNVARWLEGAAGLPLDAFVEAMEYDGARRYAQRVYRYLAIYRRIYLDEPMLYIGNDLNTDYLNNIHF